MSAPNGAPRRFAGGRLAIATHNQGKLVEIAALLAGRAGPLVSAGELGLPVPEETETSFVGNATLKALATAQPAGLPALADDSGLCVAALGGDPGVRSADWAGEPRDFGRAMARVWAALDEAGVGVDPARPPAAAFICALALAWPDGHVEAVEGRCEGHLVRPPRGTHGFGYDPIFVPRGHDLTFGELAPATKHALSHRADAFGRLVARCF